MIKIKEPSNSYKEFPGPILLLAGPGTGKTFQLAHRIKFLIKGLKVDPNEISVITFTNEAAKNMKEKLSDQDIDLSKEKYPKIIATMHRLGNMILKSGREILDLPENYQILVEKEQRKPIFRDATNLAGYNVEKWKNTAECRLKGNCVKTNGEKCKICDEYKNLLRKSARVDYDDLILLACDILEKNEKIRKEWKLKTKYLLVDEYQDINEAQCKLIQLLSKDQEDGLFVVGDDEQSIYSFRGGSTKFIANFDKYFPNNPKVGELFVSWRCSQHILLGARSMINNFYKKALPKPKPKFSAKIETNNKIVFYEVPSEGLEAYIISKIAKEKIKTNSIKIIIPNKKYFPILKKTLQKFGLNYRYKFNINQEGLIRFTILTDWLKNKDDNILFRYLIDLIIQNYDDLSKKVNEEKYGII